MIENTDPRVLVCQDVLAQLDAGKYRPTHTAYISLGLRDAIPESAHDLKDVVDLPMRHCRVCQKGAILLSKARLFNNVPLSLMDHSSNYVSGYDSSLLSDVFSVGQLNLMEIAYELDDDFEFAHQGVSVEEHMRALMFGEQFDDGEPRMRAICQNVIDNGGEFIP